MKNLLCFDLDNTLYHPKYKIMDKINLRIVKYLIEYTNISPETVNIKRKYYYETYGSTLKGLYCEERIEPIKYLEFIHNIEAYDLPLKDDKLHDIINQMDGLKIIITNSYSVYAVRVLESLGILHLFDKIYDTVFMDFNYKNSITGLKKVIELYDYSLNDIYLIDDSEDSLEAAKSIGINTIYVNYSLKKSNNYTKEINSIYDINQCIITNNMR